MSERITKNMAKNIYFGGGMFALLIFSGLTLDTVKRYQNYQMKMHESVCSCRERIMGNNNCVGCHTIIGEGAYYAPELANVFHRRGASDESTFKGYMQGWMAAQPMNKPGRRKMPQFNLSEEQVNALSDFLIWTSKVDTNEWPPNIEG